MLYTSITTGIPNEMMTVDCSFSFIDIHGACKRPYCPGAIGQQSLCNSCMPIQKRECDEDKQLCVSSKAGSEVTQR